jgi:hypothetical protein
MSRSRLSDLICATTFVLALPALSLMGCQIQNVQASAGAKPLPMPAAGKDEVVVKLQPSSLKREGVLRIGKGWFGMPTFDRKDEVLVSGRIKVDGENFEIGIPNVGPYLLTTEEDEYRNTSMRVSIDADNNGELPDHESWFSSNPFRIGDRMFTVRAVDPGGTWMTLAKSDVPLAGVILGRRCPDFELWSTSGKKLTLSDYKGKYLLLDVWSMT